MVELIKKDQSVGHLEWKGFDLSEREEEIAKQINQYVPGRERERGFVLCAVRCGVHGCV